MTRWKTMVMTVTAMAAAAAGTASADDATWKIVGVSPGEPTAQVKDPPPQIKVKIVGEEAPTDGGSSYTLTQVDGPRRKGVTPSAVIPYAKSNEPLALAVVIEGHEFYYGNNAYTPAPDPLDPDHPILDAAGNRVVGARQSIGVYDQIVGAIDSLNQGKPVGSVGALVVYSVGADVRWRGELARLTSQALGEQRQQEKKRGRDLADGLAAAEGVLRTASATRKVIFLISDGHDDHGAADLRGWRRKLDADNIDLYAFQLVLDTDYIPATAAEKQEAKQNLLALAGGPERLIAVRKPEDLGAKLTALVASDIEDRFWLVFPGAVIAKGRPPLGFTWDGKDHDLMLSKNDGDLGDKAQTITLPGWGQPKPKSRWLLWLGLGGGAALLLGLIVALSGRKPAPAPAALVVAPPAPVAPPMVKPVVAQSNKTLAINIDGIPVVGWLVPIEGPQSFQTFKLAAGVTKIGNLRGVHVLLDDGYMSGEHAHIQMTPMGFTLVDNMSTNGTYVNDRRVDRHDLIDNDVIKFGKTHCKFKTIMS